MDRLAIDVAEQVTRSVSGFPWFLREHGFHIGIRENLDTLRLARDVDVTDRRRLRAGLKSLLCGSFHDWKRFDELFESYFLPPNRSVLHESSGGAGDAGGEGQATGKPRLLADVERGAGLESGISGDSAAKGGATADDSPEQRDFRFVTGGADLETMELMVDRLAARMRRRLARRHKIARAGRELHLRRTIRNSLQHGGTPLELAFRRRRRKPPHIVLLLDVSRSMSLYTYVLLRFTRAVVRGFKRADAFLFHTRLVPVSDALKEKNVKRMRDRLALVSAGWSGGTRIGESLREFNAEYAPQLVNRRTVLMILSDGFDTGEPEMLAGELEHLKQRARRVVWLNPLLGRDGYEPTAAGMSAALPWLDLFAPAHNLESLLALESELVRL